MSDPNARGPSVDVRAGGVPDRRAASASREPSGRLRSRLAEAGSRRVPALPPTVRRLDRPISRRSSLHQPKALILHRLDIFFSRYYPFCPAFPLMDIKGGYEGVARQTHGEGLDIFVMPLSEGDAPM